MHEPTAGPRPHSSPRTEALAARLAALTGNQPRVTVGGARTRIEIDLPEALSDGIRRRLLVALAGADRCGHEQTQQGHYVWAEIGHPLPDPDTLNDDQRAGYACALCGAGLYTTQFLGSTDGLQLWACSPACQANPLASD